MQLSKISFLYVFLVLMFFIQLKDKHGAFLTSARFVNILKKNLNNFHKINIFYLHNIFIC